MHAKDARHAGGGCCSVDQVHGWEPPPLQFTCCADWSCHASLYGRPDSWTSFAHAGLSNRSIHQMCCRKTLLPLPRPATAAESSPSPSFSSAAAWSGAAITPRVEVLGGRVV